VVRQADLGILSIVVSALRSLLMHAVVLRYLSVPMWRVPQIFRINYLLLELYLCLLR
jgi:hypothetical protein